MTPCLGRRPVLHRPNCRNALKVVEIAAVLIAGVVWIEANFGVPQRKSGTQTAPARLWRTTNHADVGCEANITSSQHHS